MRKKFPAWWVLQAIVLLFAGMASLFCPETVLQYSRNQPTPHRQIKPNDELRDWVLHIETVPPVPDQVKKYFAERNLKPVEKSWFAWIDEIAEKLSEIGQPHDTTSSKKNALTESVPAEVAVRRWLLSCQTTQAEKNPVTETSAADAKSPSEAWSEVQDWVNHADWFPEISPNFHAWIQTHDTASPATAELQRFILGLDQTAVRSWEISADCVRESAPCMLVAALFTLFGLMSASVRRPLARCFVLTFVFWTVGMVWGSSEESFWTYRHLVIFFGLLAGLVAITSFARGAPGKATSWIIWSILFVWWSVLAIDATQIYALLGTDGVHPELASSLVGVAILGMINATYWLIGECEDPPQDDGGIAQGRPPQLWTIWLFQFMFLAAIGAWALIRPDVVANVFTHDSIDHLNTAVVHHSVRMLGAWLLGFALFTYFSLGSMQDWLWQGIAWIFYAVFGLFFVSAAIKLGTTDTYSWWACLYGVLVLMFCILTKRQLRHDDPWSTENIENDNADWRFKDLSIGLPMLIEPLLFRRRTLYHYGVGAAGTLHLKPLSDLNKPELEGPACNPFFNRQVSFPAQVRFSNRLVADDAGLDIRGCGLRLSNGEESPLDLVFATGSFAPINSLRNAWRILPICKFQRRVTNDKILREGLAAGLRRAPKSFTCLAYHNQLVLEWRIPNGQHYLCRFRLVPESDAVNDETAMGYPTIKDLKKLWCQDRLATESRSSDYLRQRLYDRLTDGAEKPVTFRLEVQFHTPLSSDSLEWYDASLEWDERDHPWHTIGQLVLERLLTAEENARLRFDPRNSPPSLKPPRGGAASAWTDPRSLAAAQYRISSLLGRLRVSRQGRTGSLHTARSEMNRES